MIFGKSYENEYAERVANMAKMYDGVVPRRVFTWLPVRLDNGRYTWFEYVWRYNCSLSRLHPSWNIGYTLTKAEANVNTRGRNRYADSIINIEVDKRLGA